MHSELPPETTSNSPVSQTAQSDSVDSPEAPLVSHFRFLPLDAIRTDQDQNERFALDPEALRQLADSIARLGLINPIRVRPEEDGFRLVAGFRRLEACRLLGRVTLACHIDPSPADSDAAIRLAENLERADLTVVEEARGVYRFEQTTHASPDELATRLHRSVNWIRHRLALNNYPFIVLDALHAKTISLGVADELALIQDPQQLRALLTAAIDNGCTTRQAAAWRIHANAFIGDSTGAATQPPPPHMEGPPPRVLKTCLICSREHDITTLSYVTICPTCLQQVQAVTAPPSPPHPTDTE